MNTRNYASVLLCNMVSHERQTYAHLLFDDIVPELALQIRKVNINKTGLRLCWMILCYVEVHFHTIVLAKKKPDF